MTDIFKRYWFLIGLLAVFCLTLLDTGERTVAAGIWLKNHRGPDLIIFMIFLCSGLLLRSSEVKAGFRDMGGTLLALGVIFLASPLAALAFSLFPMDTGVRIGLFLVAVMPTTLSSGVVMTGAAGGNMAHALLITILANGISVFTIPVFLDGMLGGGQAGALAIDKFAIMVKLACYVILPLGLGSLLRRLPLLPSGVFDRFSKALSTINQLLVLTIVWMAMAAARGVIVENLSAVFGIFLLSFLFHGVLVAAAAAGTHLLRIGRGRREGVIFMGGQKTLPLSVILQVSLFPQYGLALVVCVVHHVIHLMMDSYLVGKIGR